MFVSQSEDSSDKCVASSVKEDESEPEEGYFGDLNTILSGHETTEDTLGQKHLVVPSVGPSFVFMRSSRKKPSKIFCHVNDILNISQVLS